MEQQSNVYPETLILLDHFWICLSAHKFGRERETKSQFMFNEPTCLQKKKKKWRSRVPLESNSLPWTDGQCWICLKISSVAHAFTRLYGGIHPSSLCRRRFIEHFAVEAQRKNSQCESKCQNTSHCTAYSALFKVSYQRHKLIEHLLITFILPPLYISCHLPSSLSTDHNVICKHYNLWTFTNTLNTHTTQWIVQCFRPTEHQGL